MDIVPEMRINAYRKVVIPSAKELFEMFGESRSSGPYTATMDSENVPVVSGYQTKLEQVANGSRILRAEVERESRARADALAREQAAKQQPDTQTSNQTETN